MSVAVVEDNFLELQKDAFVPHTVESFLNIKKERGRLFVLANLISL